ncbi:hypothetical protein JCM17478_03890 [Thermopirellula anaerolimosa]
MLLVFVIGGAVILVTSAREWLPQADQLLRFLREPADRQALQTGPAKNSAIDTRLTPDSSEHTSRPTVSQSAVNESGVSSPGEAASPTAESSLLRTGTAETASPRSVFTTSDIDFSTVQDDQPFRMAEAGPWFAVLARLRKTDEEGIAAASQGWVTFSQLYRRSQDRRGRVVTVKGHVVQAMRMKAPKNGEEIAGYYQLWIRPSDENNPVVVYALSLPSDFPLGNRLEEPVEVHGVFFKRWAYQARDALRAAPVLLAKQIHWQRHPSVSDASTSPDLVTAVLLAALFAAGFVWYVYQKTRPKTQSDAPREVSQGASASSSQEI